MRQRGSAYRNLFENSVGRNRSKDSNVQGRIILKWIFEKWDGGIDWTDMGQDRNRWLALENAGMKLGFHKMREISSLDEACRINKPWEQFDKYSLGFLYNAQLLVPLSRT
jgi:hypothetical protein